MRILHLLRRNPPAPAIDVARAQAAAGHEVTLALLLEVKERPSTDRLRLEREIGPERLHDLLFEHDRVVSW